MGKTEKILTLILAIAVVLIGILSFSMYSDVTGKSIIEEKPFNYSYTKAICNDQNLCQDYEIYCKNGSTDPISMRPITGFVQIAKDPRSEEQINRTCRG